VTHHRPRRPPAQLLVHFGRQCQPLGRPSRRQRAWLTITEISQHPGPKRPHLELPCRERSKIISSVMFWQQPNERPEYGGIRDDQRRATSDPHERNVRQKRSRARARRRNGCRR
jgi:hypothetical protein